MWGGEDPDDKDIDDDERERLQLRRDKSLKMCHQIVLRHHARSAVRDDRDARPRCRPRHTQLHAQNRAAKQHIILMSPRQRGGRQVIDGLPP